MARSRTVYQFVKFSLVGFLNTGIHYGLFLLLFRGLGVYYLLSSALGYAAGFLNSFALNRAWTFKARGGRVRVEFIRFCIVNAAAMLLNMGSLRFFVGSLSLRPELAQLFAIGLSLVLGFTANKYWTFRQGPGPVPGKAVVAHGEL